MSVQGECVNLEVQLLLGTNFPFRQNKLLNACPSNAVHSKARAAHTRLITRIHEVKKSKLVWTIHYNVTHPSHEVRRDNTGSSAWGTLKVAQSFCPCQFIVIIRELVQSRSLVCGRSFAYLYGS